jgi:hypothetical protein
MVRRRISEAQRWQIIRCLSTGLVPNGSRLTKRCNAMSSRSDVTRGLPDLGKSFTLCVFSYQSADNSIVVAHLREPCLLRITQNSVWSRFEFGYLKNVFILSKHGTKANIRSSKMANNQHAYNWERVIVRFVDIVGIVDTQLSSHETFRKYIHRVHS